MRINSIRLHNFSSYEGDVFFDFTSTDSKKNIVLIGGKNGAGKTSLFTAIKIALYGPLAYGYVGANPHYIAKIKNLINSKAFQQDKVLSEVRISLSLKKEREYKEYIITRRWNYCNQKLNEEHFVELDDSKLDDDKMSYFENYLRSILPPDLFEFFLFDGEEVGNIFSTTSYNTYVKNAIFTLCGIDVYEIIRQQTNGYISKSPDGESDNLYVEFEAAKNEVEKLTVRKVDLENYIVQKEKRLEEIEILLMELETAFKNAGGISEQERKQYEDKYKKAEQKKTEAATKIRMFVEGLMPFIITSKLIGDISSQLEFEEKAEVFSYIQNKLTREDMKSVVGNNQTLDKLVDLINLKFMPKGYNKNNSYMFDLSKDETANVKGLISRIENFDKDEMLSFINTRINASKETERINITFKNAMSDDDSVLFTEKENKLLKEKEAITQALFSAKSEDEQVNQELELKMQLRDKIMQKIKETAQNKHVYELSSGLANMMSEFLDNRTVFMRKQLEELIVTNLRYIYRKNNLITHIEVTKDFQFNLYRDESYQEADLLYLMKNLGTSEFINQIGNHGREELLRLYSMDSIEQVRKTFEKQTGNKKLNLYKKIELNKLSKGERQIFILSLYWAIIMLSGQDIPFIIDTPYARIDANHRKEISEKFFPNISKQVIILSTDEEINEEYYKLIKPYVVKEYLLVNDENQNKTSIENRYFFEVKQ
mgnify:FL=1